MTERMVALLRGINVGKAKRVAMADLRDLLTDLGYTDVRTHLNSGNAIFSSPPKLVKQANERIQKAIAGQLKVDCAVVTRTASQLTEALSNDPFGDLATDPSRYLIGFLSHELGPAKAKAFEQRDFGEDQVRFGGPQAYLWCPGGINSSALFKTNWMKELGVTLTTRNWTTVHKLVELAGNES
ncbi:MAG: DUF1697 domain-containing protein [Jatrophihabitantaceae bacterium]